MSLKLFNPFSNLFFDDKICFLTGDDLAGTEEKLSVFPEWILKHYKLRDKEFKLMDDAKPILYGDLKLPCSTRVKEAFDRLDEEIKEAFLAGYEQVVKLESYKLFLWVGKILYGILYRELQMEKTRLSLRNEEFKLSDFLQDYFGYFHLMLQSLVSPIDFGELKPWSITVVKLKYSQDIFNYRDDTIHLFSTLGVNDFGIIVCFQDNGLIYNKQKEIVDKIGNNVLHPIQFEELCARALYLNYLLRFKPSYTIEKEGEGMLLRTILPKEERQRPFFDKWDDDMFAQVLTDYWKIWGLEKKDIYRFPNSPISFLEDEHTYEFIKPELIKLPF